MEKFSPSNDRIYIIYCFGHLFRIYPDPGKPYSKHINMIGQASFLISEDVEYDLSNKEAILQIEIPGYDVHFKNQIDKDMGIASSIEFALLEKGNYYWRTGNVVLAIAFYEKATQLMAFSDEYWTDEDFYLIVRKLDELGRHKHADKWRAWIDRNVFSLLEGDFIDNIEILKRCDPTDEKTALVNSITTDDMKKLVGFSYDFDCPVNKHIQDGSHPYAYINLNKYNRSVAKKDLELLSMLIKEYPGYFIRFPFKTNKIKYAEYNPDYGYTKLICTPKTPTGKRAKYPLTLLFMSRMDVQNYQCMGTIKYLGDGTIASAEVHIWKRVYWKKVATGRSFYLKKINGKLEIHKMNSI